VKAEVENKGNAGNSGMSGGKIHNANGDSGFKYKTYQPGKPIYGNITQSGDVESEENSFEYGVKWPKDQSTGHSTGKSLDKGQSTHVIDLSVEKIIYDADGNIVIMATKAKSGKINVLIDEVRITELSKAQIKNLKISNEEYLKALYKYITTGEANPQIGWPIECWQVPCNGSCNTGPSCPGKVWRCKWVGFAK